MVESISNSFTLLNKNNALPPLLLPNLNSTTSGLNRFHFQFQYQAQPQLIANRIDPPTLKSLLAQLDQNGFSSESSSTSVSTATSLSTSRVISPLNSHAPLSRTPSPDLQQSLERNYTFQKSKTSSTSKAPPIRKRNSSSCDYCRQRKIKCDSNFNIIRTSNQLIGPMFPDEIFHILTKKEIDELQQVMVPPLELPSTLFNYQWNWEANPEGNPILFKNKNDLILFTPCTNCSMQFTCQFKDKFHPNLPFPLGETSQSSMEKQRIPSNKKRSMTEQRPHDEEKKRQRVGPSCDHCRFKKIKCDSQIKVVLESNHILNLISNKIHYVFNADEIELLKTTLLKNTTLPEKLANTTTINKRNIAEGSVYPILLKHFDKIILFSPCTSCDKNEQDCLFSMGFTRSDIATCKMILKNLPNNNDNIKKNIFDLTIMDYNSSRTL
ncbi:hypothetical protein NCAS_0B05740 [Naumovozyma castellii]|uniref:Zn(2)-C6 fungal-type domain-containing protein n=1 Tax=Naumovozyma castellii TaxID=27288 RepID=G0V9P1_NAUCA|nr:hypothetical protein NCAS_0B05740 [Naumovozyma castellii CBS 4309]CCC68658.1 hypothetical protein NCAS_0B05740 [Naumovozyma castellii CBS 4309]